MDREVLVSLASDWSTKLGIRLLNFERGAAGWKRFIIPIPSPSQR